jgi:serine phosphatase RsbU (regulator of sigma subunit)
MVDFVRLITKRPMKRFIAIPLLFATLFNLSSQVNKYGVPFIKNYLTQITQGSEQNWCITKDKFGDVYFGSQDRGVIRYDGTKWSAIKINNNPRIYSLAPGTDGEVYVGASYEFGYLQPDEKGITEYISLTGRVDSVADIKVIYSIEVSEGRVLFLGPRHLYIYDKAKDSFSDLKLTDFNIKDAYRLFRINDRIIITDNINGIFELQGNVIKQLPGGEFFKNKLCTVLLPFDENKILVCTYKDGVFIYDYNTGAVIDNFIDKKINAKFKDVIIYAAAKISEDLFAIGTTTEEGMLVFDKSGKLVSQIMKENSDLEDNTIYAAYCDYKNNSELWISTYGTISKVYFNLPLTKFAENQGIDIGINEICKFQDNIYLSSDAGILKSYSDSRNNLLFMKLPDTNGQFFPLRVVKTSFGEYILAGSRFGVYQIFPNDVIRNIDKNIRNVPGGKPPEYKALTIYQSSIDQDKVYIGLESGGIVILRDKGSYWEYLGRIKDFEGQINGIIEKKDGVWFATDQPASLYKYTYSASDTLLVKYGTEKGIPDIKLYSLRDINDEIYLATASGILRYDKTNDMFVSDNRLTGGFSEGKTSQNMYSDEAGNLWFSCYESRSYEMFFRKAGTGVTSYRGILSLLPSVPPLAYLSDGGRMYMTMSKILSVIETAKLLPDSTKVNTRFVSIIVGSDTVMGGTFHIDIDSVRRIPTIVNPSSAVPEYGYDMNEITFQWTTPYFIEELQTEYSYMLEGYDEDWSRWQGISFGYTAEALYSSKEYTNLPYGRYNFKVRSRTLTGLTGNELSYQFVILKPWYATIWAYIGFALAAFLAIVGIISAYTRRLKNENIRLEGIVAERTAVVVKQKEELESSIHYASRIQMALLPSEAILSENIKNYFVLFKPRDIVSGDFYWMTKKEERLYIVAADCTGHGVPGAFMSLLGMSFLDEIIDKEQSPRADLILRELRVHVMDSLKQVGGDDEAKDGMDMALLVIDFNAGRIEFSGAYNPCFRVRKLTDSEITKFQNDSSEMPDGSMSNGKYLLETIYASKMPIGISSRMNEDFVFYDWILEKGISYYLFSDGYIDQFGGEHGRKFMKKNFKKMILDIQDLPMPRQKEMLEQKLRDWMGQTPQIDDILVMGIRTD